MKKILLIIVSCISLHPSAKGQHATPPAFEITSDTADHVILPIHDWQIIRDSSGDLTLKQALASLQFGETRKVNYKVRIYWQRFRLTNRLSVPAHIALPEVAAQAELYSEIGGTWQHQKTGTEVRWSQRDGLKRIPAFTLTIPPGQTVVVYKRLLWDYVALQPDTMAMSFGFTEKMIQKHYVNDESYYMTAIQDAFLLGLFVLSLVINFYFFRVVREKEFLYYCIFLVLFIAEILVSLNDVFLREHPSALIYLYLVANSFSGTALILFTRYFFKTFRRFPRWDKCLLFFSVLQVAVLFFCGIASAAFHSNLAAVSHFCEDLEKLLLGIILLTTLALYLRDKDGIIKLMLIALTPVLCLQVLTYALALPFGLYYPKFGAPDVSGYESSFNSSAFFVLILCYLWMMIFFTWVLFLRFSNLRKALAQQASLDQVKSRFFANISHEFRTPLTLIMGPIGDLLEDREAQQFREPLLYIQRNSKRLLQLINQLLDLSKLDAGNYRLNTAREDILPFVKQIVHSFSSMAHKKDILLETEVDPRLKEGLRDGVLSFYFDEDILEKILSNLLANAFKFTGDGGNITVGLGLFGKDQLEIKVEDSGIGIRPEKLPFIFDRFYQADHSSKKQYEGTGIGLALVKELVELHQGKITVISQPAKGSAFSCYFSFNQKVQGTKVNVRLGTDHKVRLPVEEANIALNEEANPDGTLPHILVVEDQQDVRKYICSKLAILYRVTEAKNGREGLEVAKLLIPDLVISDVMMPGMDGFALCRLLKTEDATCHIPLILLTARAEDADKLQGLQTGADAYLVKPFDSKELLIRVHHLIALRKKLRKKFSARLVVKASEITVTPQDSQFMQRLLETVERNLGNENFTVEQLGSEFGMSTSQINRKLKAIINQPAGTFIRSIRMERAIELLKYDGASIAEVSYKTGFAEPAYFSRVFKNHFGYPPSETKRSGIL